MQIIPEQFKDYKAAFEADGLAAVETLGGAQVCVGKAMARYRRGGRRAMR